MTPTFETLIPALTILAEKVGAYIARIYEEEIDVTQKGDGSPVTKADQQSHTMIKAELEVLTPGIPVISEEDESSWELKSPLYWLIDPLDGTKGFIYKTGDFCINVALMKNDVPIFGMIHIPLTKETFFGYEGKALRIFKGEKSLIQTRPFPTEGLTLLLGGHGKKFKEQEDFFLKTFPISQIKRMRSAIKFCFIAMGSADLYIRFEPCSEWDTAAGQAIVEAAGGIMTSVDGTPFFYGKQGLINAGFVVFGRKP